MPQMSSGTDLGPAKMGHVSLVDHARKVINAFNFEFLFDLLLNESPYDCSAGFSQARLDCVGDALSISCEKIDILGQLPCRG